jgi:hypothetical protein
VRAACLVLLAACGRLGFEANLGEGEGEGEFEPVDGDRAPVANLLCNPTRAAVGSLLPTGELAVTATAGGGFFAAWTGTSSQPASVVKLDAQLRVVARQPLNVTNPQLMGVLDIGTDVLLAYHQYDVVDLWKLTADLSIVNYFETLAGLAARRPFVANSTGSQRAYLAAYANSLLVGAMAPDGYTNRSEIFDMTGSILEVSGDSSTSQGIAVWVEDLGGGASSCSTGDIRFDSPSGPGLAAVRPVSGDCRSVRVAAGPTDDARLVVSTTARGAVEAHYLTASASVVRTLSSSGRAPKVRFDGTRFWIAWLDRPAGTSSDELRVVAFDLSGNLVSAGSSAPRVAGDHAFDLVRAGSTVHLVVLTADGLDFVTLCR